MGATEPAMRTENGTKRELCGSCIYAADCAARSRSDGPVICCDRYLGPGSAGKGEPAAPRTQAVPNAKRQAEGLCGTCADRDKCKRRYVEGGVFRCADYR
jgi:hypothetical protein